MKNLVEQLNNIKREDINPSSDWVSQNKEILMSQIKNTVSPKEAKLSFGYIWQGASVFLPQRFVFSVVRPLAVLLIVALVTTGSWVATVDASYNAVPGDWLYPAKRVTEKTKVMAAVLVGADDAETKLHVEHAKRRAAEVKVLVVSEDENQKSKVKETVSDLKKEVNTVKEKIDLHNLTSNEDGKNGTAKVAKEVKETSQELSVVLKDIKDGLSVSGQFENMALSAEVDQVKQTVKETEVKALELVVNKHLEGDNSVSTQEVQDLIDGTLQAVSDEVEENKQKVADAQQAVTEVKQNIIDVASTTAANLLAEEDSDVPASTTVSSTEIVGDKSVSSTEMLAQELNTKLEGVEQQTKEAALKTEGVQSQVNIKINEAKDLVSSGDFVGAVIKIKEASLVAEEAEDINDAVVANVKQVMPVVVIVKEGEEIDIPVPAKEEVDIEVNVVSTTVNQTSTEAKEPVVEVVE